MSRVGLSLRISQTLRSLQCKVLIFSCFKTTDTSVVIVQIFHEKINKLRTLKKKRNTDTGNITIHFSFT